MSPGSRSLLRSREMVLLHDCPTYLGVWKRHAINITIVICVGNDVPRGLVE